MLLLRRHGRPVTVRTGALAAAAVVVLAVALVAIDAATGGSSHVTHSLGSGSVFGDLAHRWHSSAINATRSAGVSVMFWSGLAIIAGILFIRRPRPALADAMLVALLVSFVVNDTPSDVSLWGSLSGLALLGFARTRVG
jgi:hypothetical protein